MRAAYAQMSHTLQGERARAGSRVEVTRSMSREYTEEWGQRQLLVSSFLCLVIRVFCSSSQPLVLW